LGFALGQQNMTYFSFVGVVDEVVKGKYENFIRKKNIKVPPFFTPKTHSLFILFFIIIIIILLIHWLKMKIVKMVTLSSHWLDGTTESFSHAFFFPL